MVNSVAQVRPTRINARRFPRKAAGVVLKRLQAQAIAPNCQGCTRESFSATDSQAFVRTKMRNGDADDTAEPV